jgi:cell volume regulation protein A
MESFHLLVLIGAGLLFTGLLLGNLSLRFGVPSLLVFLVLGMLAGVDGPGGLKYDDFATGFLVSNIALAVILLDGGLRTRLHAFRVGLAPALMLAVPGVMMTAGLVGAFAAWLTGVDWRLALMLGGIIASTDAAAVFNVIKSAGLRLNDRVASTLEVESGLNDPIAIFITVSLIELWQQQGGDPGWTIVLDLIRQIGLGALGGLVLGLLLSVVLVRLRSNEGLHALMLCSGGASVFALISLIGGSGFLAAYLCGLVAGNLRGGASDNVLRAMDSMAWLAQSAMFLLLGLLVTPSELLNGQLLGMALVIAFFLILVARPAAVALCLLPFDFNGREQSFIAWTGLRGAVPIVLAVFPLLAGIDGARWLFNITFVVVLTSLLLQGSTMGLLARWLRITLPPAAEPRQAVALKGTGGLVMARFQVDPGSRADGLDLHHIEAGQARAMAVTRNHQTVNARDLSTLQAADLVTWFCTPTDQDHLSEWFRAGSAELRAFFGDFTVRADVTVADMAMAYGLTDVTTPDLNRDLNQLFQRHARGAPVVGDRCRLGALTLRVRSVQGKKVTLVGVTLPSA